MAHFIGYVQGTRGEASRLGDKNKGLTAQAQGWNIGAKIYMRYNEKTKKDEVVFDLTGGTNHPSSLKTLVFTEDDI